MNKLEWDERVVRGDLGSIAAFDKDGGEAKQYWDDLSGKRLKPELGRKARSEEMSEFRKHGVYIKVPLNSAGMRRVRIQLGLDG